MSRRIPRTACIITAAVMVGLVAIAWSASQAPARLAVATPAQLARGSALYTQSCSSCHATDLQGISGRGPTLRGAGTAAVDFYLSTGRMPLSRPGIEPERADPAFNASDIAALEAYIQARAPGGPTVPAVDPSAGNLAEGRRLYADSCSGCHQIMGQGGIATGLVAPPLTDATAAQVGEAIRVGPYLMPRFSERRLDDRQVDSIARYVTEITQHPPNRGGWGIGNIGPIPEGLVAFLLAGSVLLLVARLIGERTRT